MKSARLGARPIHSWHALHHDRLIRVARGLAAGEDREASSIPRELSGCPQAEYNRITILLSFRNKETPRFTGLLKRYCSFAPRGFSRGMTPAFSVRSRTGTPESHSIQPATDLANGDFLSLSRTRHRQSPLCEHTSKPKSIHKLER